TYTTPLPKSTIEVGRKIIARIVRALSINRSVPAIAIGYGPISCSGRYGLFRQRSLGASFQKCLFRAFERCRLAGLNLRSQFWARSSKCLRVLLRLRRTVGWICQVLERFLGFCSDPIRTLLSRVF